VRLVEHDLTSGLGLPEFDLVVSNPPYVLPSEELQAELDYEPREALVDRGQTLALVEAARDVLDGWLVLEVHEGRAQEVAAALEGYADVSITHDLAGRERVVEGRWTR
jgi:release factor glutamine methyltransferase